MNYKRKNHIQDVYFKLQVVALFYEHKPNIYYVESTWSCKAEEPAVSCGNSLATKHNVRCGVLLASHVRKQSGHTYPVFFIIYYVLFLFSVTQMAILKGVSLFNLAKILKSVSGLQLKSKNSERSNPRT